jgi:cysteinyl-tRNA synthetase
MIEQELGLPIDIHGGGIDLVFPHHENERAQGVCATHDQEYSAFWLHNGFLNFGDEKMSKSLGNVALAHELLKTMPGEAIRWALLVGHYRAPLEWNAELLEQAKNALDRLYRVLADADRFLREATDLVARDTDMEPRLVRTAHEAFIAALEDDLNTAGAFAALFQMADQLRAAIMERDVAAVRSARGRLAKDAGLIGFLQADPEAWFQGGADEDLKARIGGLLAARDAARVTKDWPEADRIRAELTALNVEVMDGPAGATWRIKE